MDFASLMNVAAKNARRVNKKLDNLDMQRATGRKEETKSTVKQKPVKKSTSVSTMSVPTNKHTTPKNKNNVKTVDPANIKAYLAKKELERRTELRRKQVAMGSKSNKNMEKKEALLNRKRSHSSVSGVRDSIERPPVKVAKLRVNREKETELDRWKKAIQKMKKSKDDNEDSSEDEEFYADFIDDNDYDEENFNWEEFEESLRIINPRYDKELWKKREKQISERSMESSYRDIVKEEARSGRLGYLEDRNEARKNRSRAL